MYRKQIDEIKFKMLIGALTYDEAKEEMEPIIDEMNKKGAEIAKKHNQKFRPFTFSNLMR